MIIDMGFTHFEPDYRRLMSAAWNNPCDWLPLYEHGIDRSVMAAITGLPVKAFIPSDSYDQKRVAYGNLCDVALSLGYDCIPFEHNVARILQDGKGIRGQAPALISSREELELFPWGDRVNQFIARYAQDYEILRQVLPVGMKAVGGIGNGVFEAVQDLVPYHQLAFLLYDDYELFCTLFERVGDMIVSLWSWLLDNYDDCFAVYRFGDDLGFKSSVLLPPDVIRSVIVPQYARITEMVHRKGKPFLLHSCGNIHVVMEDLISCSNIDAKHSNEDVIDPFKTWVEQYGNRIGNFGGVDMNLLTLATSDEVRKYVVALLEQIVDTPGVAIGSGNQISPSTNGENYLAMVDTVREFRGEKRKKNSIC